MITGEDTVVIVGRADASSLVHRLLSKLNQRWPDMKVAINDVVQQDFVQWSTWEEKLPGFRGDVMVARDEEARIWWEENGYVADLSGEGPVTIYYEACKAGIIRTRMLDEPYARRAGYRFDPFDALLVGDGCSVLTIVSPEGASAFHEDLVAMLARSMQEECAS